MKIYSGISKEIAPFVIDYTNMLMQVRCDCWGCVKASHEMDDKNELLKKKTITIQSWTIRLPFRQTHPKLKYTMLPFKLCRPCCYLHH